MVQYSDTKYKYYSLDSNCHGFSLDTLKASNLRAMYFLLKYDVDAFISS